MIALLLWSAAIMAPPAATRPPETAWRVAGTVTSSRDGSSIPHCRLTFTPVSHDGNSEERLRGRPDGTASGFAGVGQIGVRSPFIPHGQPPEDQQTVTTDAQGRFSTSLPHAGSWQLVGAARGFRSATYQEHGRFFTAIVLSAQVPAARVDLVLKPSASIQGFVLDEAGEPVDAGQVSVQRRQPTQTAGAPTRWVPAASTRTDDRGHYEVSGLEDGDYRVAVSAHPWFAANAPPPGNRSTSGSSDLPTDHPEPSLDVVFPVTWFPGSTEERSADTLALHAGEERQADLHLQSIPALHLLVPGAPLQDAAGEPQVRQIRGGAPQVTRELGSGSPFGGMGGQSITMARDGTWNIGGLSPGTYQVRTADTPGSPEHVMEITLAANSAGSVGLANAVPLLHVSVGVQGADANELRNVTLTDTASGATFSSMVRGRRRFVNSPHAGAQPDEESAGEARSVEVPPGDYFVEANLNPGYTLAGLTAKGAQLTGRILHLTDGTPELSLQVRHGRASLQGTVAEAGKPVAGAMILLVPASYGSPGSLAPIRQAQTATDGSFRVGLVAAGPYLVVALAHGWAVDWHDPATLAHYLAQGSPLTIPEGGVVTEHLQAQEP